MERDICDSARKVYAALGDSLSRRIYAKRTLFSLTGDWQPLREMLLLTEEGRAFREALDMLPPRMLCLIYGAGERGRYLPFWWDAPWAGYIDQDAKKQGSRIHGLTVYSLETARKEYPDAAIVITNRYGYEGIEATLLEGGVLPRRIINFARIAHRLETRQYFDLDALPHVSGECFVDGGAFDGASSLAFQRWCGDDYAHVYAFEPDAANRARCTAQFASRLPSGSYDVIPRGLWSSMGGLSFQDGQGAFSSLQQGGREFAAVGALDEELRGKRITFLKLDIEGAEQEALQGAAQILREQQPKCAISVYHKPKDIFSLPALLLEWYPNSRLYLRHYLLREYDTVLYVVPQ